MVLFVLISIEQKEKDEKNLVRIAKELDRTEDSLKLIDDDLGKVRVINRAVRDKLHREEEKIFQEEEGLKVCSKSATVQGFDI